MKVRAFWNRYPLHYYVGMMFVRYGGHPGDGDVSWRISLGLIRWDCGIVVTKFAAKPVAPLPWPY